ncbi:hypothetical protein Mgra_00007885 [Meloidogyne graminicola]|uniref:Uncharacterized protein n=1 Tax=Meloidogyne graminicola TaxID=189291 RepID=A0A8S9ZHR0_9BILA|nr:hypothetical protein Mgra_00007885 [Meloidogyne graminicola]
MSVIPPMCNPIYANIVVKQMENNNNNSSTGNAKINVGNSSVPQKTEKTSVKLIPKSLSRASFEVIQN